MASANQFNSLDDQVLVEEKSLTRIITLNRPRQLNALSGNMITQLLKLFMQYEDDPNVHLVIVKGRGKAFCAGGDVTAVTQGVRQGHWSFGTQYFGREFTLNYIIATFSKTQVSLLNGIVMGGGAGLSIHGRFRVSTENTIFAMPETALGLFPDVGASYFLSRLPGFLGEYCGLTGARLDGAEMLACGLATHYVPSGKLVLLEEALSKIETADLNTISRIIDKYAEEKSVKKNSALNRMGIINLCFSKRTVEEVLSSLEQEAAKRHDPWIGETIESLKKASPTSLKITLKSIRVGRLQSIDQCLICDYRIVSHILREDVNGDFFEGCRAILVDKDKNPKWEPSKLEMINDATVDIFFSKAKDETWKDLELPLVRNGVSKL